MKASDFDNVLNDLENEIARLRALYEQYFQGLERRPPVRLRERLDRQVRRLRRDQPNNTAMRFKYQTIFQRWITFTQYWDRISRRIEEGTYARDIRRARQRRARAERAERAEPVAEGPKSVEVELDLDTDLDAEISAALAALGESTKPPPVRPSAGPLSLPDMDLDAHPAPVSRPPLRAPTAPPAPAGRPAAPPPPARTAPPVPPRTAPPVPPRTAPPVPGAAGGRPPPPPVPRPAGAAASRPPVPARPRRADGLGDADVRQIFDRYVEARKRVGQRPDGVSYEKLAGQIKRMEPELRRKHAGKRIDFEVVVKNGRVGLKPVAKRETDE